MEAIVKGKYYYQVPNSNDRFTKLQVTGNSIKIVQEQTFEYPSGSGRKGRTQGDGRRRGRSAREERHGVQTGAGACAELFDGADYVDVVGTSKGKGFQGVVKRHGFGGVGQSTHGQHNRARKPGSIGACSYPAKVFKGMRMGGQMGGDRVTVQNLQVLKVIAEHNLLLIKGSVPGCKGSIVLIEK